jgi:hypothetical protein
VYANNKEGKIEVSAKTDVRDLVLNIGFADKTLDVTVKYKSN